MKRGQILVRAIDKNGNAGLADIFDLEEESFRAYVLSMMIRKGIVTGVVVEDFVPGDKIVFKTKTAFGQHNNTA